MQKGCLDFKASLGCSTRETLVSTSKQIQVWRRPGAVVKGTSCSSWRICGWFPAPTLDGSLAQVTPALGELDTLLWPPGAPALICTNPLTGTQNKMKQTNLAAFWNLWRVLAGRRDGTWPSLPPSFGGNATPLLSLKLQEAGASCLALSQYLPTALQLSQTAWQL